MNESVAGEENVEGGTFFGYDFRSLGMGKERTFGDRMQTWTKNKNIYILTETHEKLFKNIILYFNTKLQQYNDPENK